MSLVCNMHSYSDGGDDDESGLFITVESAYGHNVLNGEQRC